MFSYILESVRSFRTKCNIVFINEYPQKPSIPEDPSRLIQIWSFQQSYYHVYSKKDDFETLFLLYMGVAAIFVI